jgi:hypothetical protein
MEMHKQKILIISNNPLSNTRNNGKTVLSYFDCLPKEQVFQLYFNAEKPAIEGYRYYQISDSDVLRGWFDSSRRGRAYDCVPNSTARTVQQPRKQNSTAIPKKPVYRLLREVLWFHHWKSRHFLEWLDEIRPTAVFFVGGDCAFAYDICRFVVERYQARLTLYITDDYLLPYPEDTLIVKIRKGIMRSKVQKCLATADCFYTVSQPMQRAYAELFGRNSDLAVNMPDSLKIEHCQSDNEQIVLLYAGSLYYGRGEVLGRIAQALHQHNCVAEGKKAVLHVYTNSMPNEATRKMLEKDGAAQYKGSLGPDELKLALNQADILVFAESFDPEQIRKTKFSLSTKIPEYLSVGKPILAVGPKGIGSIDYLSDCAMCIADRNQIERKVAEFMKEESALDDLAQKAQKKYMECHDKKKIQYEMMQKVCGQRISEGVIVS